MERIGKLNLERIVVHHHPELFTEEDIEIAQATLEGKVMSNAALKAKLAPKEVE